MKLISFQNTAGLGNFLHSVLYDVLDSKLLHTWYVFSSQLGTQPREIYVTSSTGMSANK
jgi:hypothetical protein